MDKVVNQLYVITEGKGPLYQGNHVATFDDGTAHLVIANIAKDKETFKIKIGPQIHLFEYLDIIEPICLNETGLIKAIQCPQCGNHSLMIINLDHETDPVHAVKCGNCPLEVTDPKRDMNQLITIWNNIPRWENL